MESLGFLGIPPTVAQGGGGGGGRFSLGFRRQALKKQFFRLGVAIVGPVKDRLGGGGSIAHYDLDG